MYVCVHLHAPCDTYRPPPFFFSPCLFFILWHWFLEFFAAVALPQHANILQPFPFLLLFSFFFNISFFSGFGFGSCFTFMGLGHAGARGPRLSMFNFWLLCRICNIYCVLIIQADRNLRRWKFYILFSFLFFFTFVFLFCSAGRLTFPPA